MCMVVYAAFAERMPVSGFKEGQTYFYLQEIGSNEVVKKQFSLSYVYYCGSFTGCGCGFVFDFNQQEDEDEKRENENGFRSVSELFDFLRGRIKNTAYAEIYSCWEGDEDKQKQSDAELDLSGFKLDRDFEFNERELVRITNSPIT